MRGYFYVCKGLGGGTRSRYYTSEYHKLQPEDGPHTGPKHVVVSPMY